MKQATTIKKGYIAKRNPKTPDDILKFQFNPMIVRRSSSAVYNEIRVSGADHLSPASTHRPNEWMLNTPEMISLSLNFLSNDLIHGGKVLTDIKDILDRLRSFRLKDDNTGDVPDLVLSLGSSVDVVRIKNYEETIDLWTPNMLPKKATINLTLEVIFAGRK